MKLYHSEQWNAHSPDRSFSIEIARWSWQEPKNQWAIYATIHPKHYLYNDLLATNSEIYRVDDIVPCLHKGCTLNRLLPSGAIKIGADYQHLGDDRFSSLRNLDESYTINRDAERLYNFLINYQTKYSILLRRFN